MNFFFITVGQAGFITLELKKIFPFPFQGRGPDGTGWKKKKKTPDSFFLSIFPFLIMQPLKSLPLLILDSYKWREKEEEAKFNNKLIESVIKNEKYEYTSQQLYRKRGDHFRIIFDLFTFDIFSSF